MQRKSHFVFSGIGKEEITRRNSKFGYIKGMSRY